MKKQKLFILALILIFIAIAILSVFGKKIPFSCYQSTDHNGWVCEHILVPFEYIYKTKCTNQTGKFSQLRVIPQGNLGPYSCFISYSDANKPCNNSDMCQGGCKYLGSQFDKIPEGCKKISTTSKAIVKSSIKDEKLVCSHIITGACTESRIGDSCTTWNEVLNNEVIFHISRCMF